MSRILWPSTGHRAPKRRDRGQRRPPAANPERYSGTHRGTGTDRDRERAGTGRDRDGNTDRDGTGDRNGDTGTGTGTGTGTNRGGNRGTGTGSQPGRKPGHRDPDRDPPRRKAQLWRWRSHYGRPPQARHLGSGTRWYREAVGHANVSSQQPVDSDTSLEIARLGGTFRWPAVWWGASAVQSSPVAAMSKPAADHAPMEPATPCMSKLPTRGNRDLPHRHL